MTRLQDEALKGAVEGGIARAQDAANNQHSGRLATLISAIALAFSGYTFYETALKAPAFSVYVPPRIDYTDPDRPDSPFEVFVLPLTLNNDGARTGTVLSIDLLVKNLRSGDEKRFYASDLGSWGEQPRRPFTPVALAGKASFSEAVQFVPRNDEKVARILDLEPGSYRLTVTLNTAEIAGGLPLIGARAQPLVFDMQMGQMDYRNFTGTGTMAMWNRDYAPASNALK